MVREKEALDDAKFESKATSVMKIASSLIPLKKVGSLLSGLGVVEDLNAFSRSSNKAENVRKTISNQTHYLSEIKRLEERIEYLSAKKERIGCHF